MAKKVLPFLPFPDQPEPPPPTQPPDHTARAQALDIHRSFIVEAPAGSGKTGLLIQRYLKLLADESVTTPEQVLAITFTLKATAELRDRVLTELSAPGLDSETWEAEPQTSNFARETRTLAKAVLARDHQLNWQLLTHPHRLNLRTIDSVCAEIARTLPVLSGSGGRLTPIPEATPLYREAARRTLLLLGSGDPVLDEALRDLLLHRDGNLADCESLLADMLALRDQWGALIPLTNPHLDDTTLDAEVLPRLQATLEQAICAELAKLTPLIEPGILAELATLAADMAHSDGYKGEPSPIAFCKDCPLPPGTDADDLVHWQALIHLLVKPSKPRDWRKSVSRNIVLFEIEKHHKAQLEHIIARLSESPELFDALCRIDALPPAQYPADQWAVAKSLFRVLARALVELQLVFATRGQCDFTELSLLARFALDTDSGPEDLASALGARLQHLLVDEMQDTSAPQYDLIQILTATWDGHSQTVFLVGDPRQSIYLFRQARVERFIATLHTQRLGDLPLTHLRLTANFRSQETLVQHFNETFAPIFPQSPAETLPYTPAEPILPPSSQSTGLNWHANPVEIRPAPQSATIPGAPSQSLGAPFIAPLPHAMSGRPQPSVSTPTLTPAQHRQRQAKRDARAIRRLAEQWFNKPLPPGRTKPWQIAVLVRGRAHLAEIVADFTHEKLARIPHRAVDITPLNERQEVLDLTALTRALLHPADRVAILAILRAPWCGLSLADLHTLTGAESDDPTLKTHSIQRLIADRGHLLPDDSIQRMTRIWHILEAAATQRARLTTAQLVERAWRSLGGDAWLKPEEILNARRFFQLLDELESSGNRIDTTQLETRLQRLYAEPDTIPAGTPYVELLTIHASKGLEWDVVIVPALERMQMPSRGRLLTWAELDLPTATPIMLAPIAAKGEEIDALTTWLKSIHKEREAAERKRLVYVAATRAREELHLFAAPDLLVSGKINPRHDSLIKAAWPAAESYFTATLATRLGDSSRDARPALPTAEPLVTDLAAAATIHEFPSNAALTPHTSNLKPENPETTPPHPTLQRLPITFDPATQFTTARTQRLPYAERDTTPEATPTQFTRPEGSFAARSFGNVVHTFLELLATRIAAGTTPATLLTELPSYTPRIAAILRADGLPPTTVDRLTRETRTALENLLRDPNGLWLLTAHPSAASELALTAQDTPQESPSETQLASIRIDRIFHAGPEPHVPGQDYLWIIDYKTADHGPTGLHKFLEEQRATYAPQLETYARILAPAHAKQLTEIRLALYYPTIPHLVWWKPDSTPYTLSPTP